MRYAGTFVVGIWMGILFASSAFAGLPTTAIRETAELIWTKFGKGAAGKSVNEVTEATGKVVTRYGDDALPFVRKSGHAGFTALENAGVKAPEIIKLYARKGDEAIWLISEPKKLAIFIKHGDSAADALLKHPDIADTLIGRYGDDAVGALNMVSRQSAQRLNMVANDGLLTATKRSSELLPVISRFGDGAMDFIWKNKGPLTVASVLTTFLADPQAYISGAKELIVDPIVAPLVKNTNWTLIIAGILAVVFLPVIARSISNARAGVKNNQNNS